MRVDLNDLARVDPLRTRLDVKLKRDNCFENRSCNNRLICSNRNLCAGLDVLHVQSSQTPYRLEAAFNRFGDGGHGIVDLKIDGPHRLPNTYATVALIMHRLPPSATVSGTPKWCETQPAISAPNGMIPMKHIT
jgi:hypothetical protein